MKLIYSLKRQIIKRLYPFPLLQKRVIEVADLASLKQAMSWEKDPVVEGDYLRQFTNDLDVNFRRLLDAQVIGSACCNAAQKIVLEIGTSDGRMTTIMSQNAPQATVHTVNILPEEIAEGGKYISYAPGRDTIGQHYREAGCTNVKQIFANTANWSPDFGPIDVAFIDGCHDWDFVYNDTRKVLKKCKPGSIILWHDLDLTQAIKHRWMGDVAWGLEKLYRKKLLQGPIYHLHNSWVGVYRVPDHTTID